MTSDPSGEQNRDEKNFPRSYGVLSTPLLHPHLEQHKAQSRTDRQIFPDLSSLSRKNLEFSGF